MRHNSTKTFKPEDASDFVSLALAQKLTGRSYSYLWTLAASNSYGGRRMGPKQRWHIRREWLADLPPSRTQPRRAASERPWLRLVADNSKPAANAAP